MSKSDKFHEIPKKIHQIRCEKWWNWTKIFNPLIPKDFFGVEWKANSFKTFSRVNQICDSKRTFLHTNKLHLSIARFCLINCEVLYTIHVTGISLNYACVNFSPVLQHRFIEIGNKMLAKFYEMLINFEKQKMIAKSGWDLGQK